MTVEIWALEYLGKRMPHPASIPDTVRKPLTVSIPKFIIGMWSPLALRMAVSPVEEE